MQIVHSSPVLIFLFALGLGCGEPVPQPLEAVEVVAQSTMEALDTEAGIEVSGAVSVMGESRDLSLSSSNDDGELLVDLHTPGGLGLGAFHGREGRLVLSTPGLHQERNVALYDASGLAYLAIGSSSWDLAEEAFGAGFVDYGSTIATDRDRQYHWAYTTAVFQSDEGPVELGIGERSALQIDGITWEVVVISAYRVEPRTWAALPCGGISDMLSFEMVRVSAWPIDGLVERAPGREMAHLGCL